MHEAPISIGQRDCLVYVLNSLSGCVHYLQRGTAAQFLLNVCHDTHPGALVYFKGYSHELTVNFVQRLALCGDEVTYVSDVSE